MSVLIVIPTVTGREDYLDNCLAHYGATLGEKGWRKEWDVAVIPNRPTCGEAWNVGASMAREEEFDYVHMTADDLIPHAGWYEAAVETINQGDYRLPGAIIYKPDGTLEDFGNRDLTDYSVCEGASVPFCRTKDWIDIPNIHYWSDNAFDYAQKKINGYAFYSRPAYAFTHYTAQVGRKGLDDAERQIFEEWKETL